MEITLTRINEDVLFEGVTPEGLAVKIDGSDGIGGTGAGPRPMQVFLMSMSACSSIDVVTILKKMRQEITTFEVHVKGDRVDTVPKVFHTITLHFKIGGDVKEEKARQAIEMSLTKYCSVSKMLMEAIDVNYELTIL